MFCPLAQSNVFLGSDRRERSNPLRRRPEIASLRQAQDQASRSFLSQVAETYISEAQAPALRDLISDGGLDRLVMASGGVARDFLGIFRRSIDETRERLNRNPGHSRGEKIGAEDVNMATGNYGDTKREEFQKDTLEDQQRLDEAFTKIRVFCLEKTNANVFLIDQETSSDDYDLVQELIDLRLVHHVRSTSPTFLDASPPVPRSTRRRGASAKPSISTSTA